MTIYEPNFDIENVSAEDALVHCIASDGDLSPDEYSHNERFVSALCDGCTLKTLTFTRSSRENIFLRLHQAQGSGSGSLAQPPSSSTGSHASSEQRVFYEAASVARPTSHKEKGSLLQPRSDSDGLHDLAMAAEPTSSSNQMHPMPRKPWDLAIASRTKHFTFPLVNFDIVQSFGRVREPREAFHDTDRRCRHFNSLGSNATARRQGSSTRASSTILGRKMVATQRKSECPSLGASLAPAITDHCPVADFAT